MPGLTSQGASKQMLCRREAAGVCGLHSACALGLLHHEVLHQAAGLSLTQAMKSLSSFCLKGEARADIKSFRAHVSRISLTWTVS